MRNFFDESKQIIVKTLEEISSTASKMAINTKYKAKEMSLESSRTELINKLGRESYDLWQKGVSFPADIEKILNGIKDLDEKITLLKAERFSYLDPKIAKDLKQNENNDHANEEK